MSKSKQRRPPREEMRAALDGPAALKQNGLKAFQHNDYDTAIASWSQLDAASQPAVAAALAEAHFRRALQAPQISQRLKDLQRATELVPDEGRFWYHIGLAHHREGRLAEASGAYARAAGAGFSRRKALEMVRALAEIERNPGIDLARLPWLGADERALLTPVAALLRCDAGAAFTATSAISASSFRATAMGALWRGLALLSSGQPVAAQVSLTLQAGQALPRDAEVVRLVYYGLTLVAQGKREEAFTFWNSAAQRLHAPRLQEAMLGLRLARVRSALSAEQWAEVAELAEVGIGPQDTIAANDEWKKPLLAAALVAHHRLARQAVQRSEWAEASKHWESMLALLAQAPAFGPRSQLWQSLACTYEFEQKWGHAAGAWNELLRSLPKREAKAKAGRVDSPAEALPLAERRSWIRQRILECYKRAGEPGQAITLYRQAVKADPDNLDLRLELAQALFANDQQIAARNELKRILEKDPRNLAAYRQLAELHEARGETFEAEQALRKALKVDPNYEPARYGLGEMLVHRAQEQFDWGNYRFARASAEEALQYRPDSSEAWATLGDIALTEKKPDHDAARTCFENALKRAHPEAYLDVLQRWVWHGDMEEGRALIARAESAGIASADFYVDAARMGFEEAAATMQRTFWPTSKTRKKKPTPDGWKEWAGDLLRMAEQKAGPQAPQLWRHIVWAIGPFDPTLGITYAQRLLESAPLDVEVYLMLGIMQCLLPDQMTQGKQTLRKGRQIARQQGNVELEQRIDEVLDEVSGRFMGPGLLGGPALPDLSGGRFDAPDLW